MQIAKWTGALWLVACLLSPGARAQDRIGYVNLNAVLEGTIEGKAIVSALQKEYEGKQQELAKRMKEFEEKAKQFQAQAKMLKDDVRAERVKALSQEEQQLQGLMMQFQGEINKKKGEVLGKFEEKLRGVLEQVAKSEKLDYVIRHEALLYGPPKMDVTNEVIREYDRRHSGKKAEKGSN